MKQDIRRYFVSPSVAVPGRETVFTVVPREGAFYFSPDVDYHVSVTPMHVDRDAPEPDYHLHGEGGVRVLPISFPPRDCMSCVFCLTATQRAGLFSSFTPLERIWRTSSP